MAVADGGGQLDESKEDALERNEAVHKGDDSVPRAMPSDLHSVATPCGESVVAPTDQVRLSPSSSRQTHDRAESGGRKARSTRMANQESQIISKVSEPHQIYQEIFSEKGAVDLEEDGSASRPHSTPAEELT